MSRVREVNTTRGREARSVSRGRVRDTDRGEVVESFRTVRYIDTEKANELYDLGFRNIGDLRRGIHKAGLNYNQSLALDFREDLQTPIPRKELKEWEDFFTEDF